MAVGLWSHDVQLQPPTWAESEVNREENNIRI